MLKAPSRYTSTRAAPSMGRGRGASAAATYASASPLRRATRVRRRRAHALDDGAPTRRRGALHTLPRRRPPLEAMSSAILRGIGRSVRRVTGRIAGQVPCEGRAGWGSREHAASSEGELRRGRARRRGATRRPKGERHAGSLTSGRAVTARGVIAPHGSRPDERPVRGAGVQCRGTSAGTDRALPIRAALTGATGWRVVRRMAVTRRKQSTSKTALAERLKHRDMPGSLTNQTTRKRRLSRRSLKAIFDGNRWDRRILPARSPTRSHDAR